MASINYWNFLKIAGAIFEKPFYILGLKGPCFPPRIFIFIRHQPMMDSCSGTSERHIHTGSITKTAFTLLGGGGGWKSVCLSKSWYWFFHHLAALSYTIWSKVSRHILRTVIWLSLWHFPVMDINTGWAHRLSLWQLELCQGGYLPGVWMFPAEWQPIIPAEL
jgi:hypothetical protein